MAKVAKKKPRTLAQKIGGLRHLPSHYAKFAKGNRPLQNMMYDVGVCGTGMRLHTATKTFAEMLTICAQTEEGSSWFWRKRSTLRPYIHRDSRKAYDVLLRWAQEKYPHSWGDNTLARIRFIAQQFEYNDLKSVVDQKS